MTNPERMALHLDLSLGTALTLSEAWLLYTHPNGAVQDVRRAAVVHDASGPRLGVGSALGRRGLEKALEALAPRAFALLHPHILASDGRRMVFYTPPETRSLRFDSGDPALNALDGHTFPQPALVFEVQGKRVRVAALRGKNRPGAGTPLYRAPYFNVFQTTLVCWGNTFTPPGTDPANPLVWRDAFFSSSFTHQSCPLAPAKFGGSHAELWRAAEKQGKFDSKWLRPLEERGRGLTLEGWLRQVG